MVNSKKMIVSCSLVSHSGNSTHFALDQTGASEGEPHLSRLDFSHFPNLARAQANTHFPKTAEPSYSSLNLLSFVQMCTIQPIKRLVYYAKKHITLTGISCSTFRMYNPFFNSKSFNLISESNTMNTVAVSLLK